MANRDEPEDPEDAFAEDDMFGQRERFGAGRAREQRPRMVSEFVRRAIENTVGSVSNTGTLSREALNYLLHQGDKGKREVVRIVAQEVGEFLRGIDLSSEVVKVLSNLEVEVNASIKFKPSKDGSVKPEITSETVVKEIDHPDEPVESSPPQAAGREPSKPPSEGS